MWGYVIKTKQIVNQLLNVNKTDLNLKSPFIQVNSNNDVIYQLETIVSNY